MGLFTVYNFTSVCDQRVHQTKGRSWRTDCPLILAACHKFGQGDRVRSLHESKIQKALHIWKLPLHKIQHLKKKHYLMFQHLNLSLGTELLAHELLVHTPPHNGWPIPCIRCIVVQNLVMQLFEFIKNHEFRFFSFN